jgi:hypothetical protein
MNRLKNLQLLACGLLFLALANLPYGYYQFLRIVITIIAGINAVNITKSENKILFYVFLTVTILFNPIIPIYFDKKIWMPIDLSVGIIFGVTFFIKTTKRVAASIIK